MTHRTARARTRQRGTVYLVVLAVSMLITAIGLSAMLAVRVQRRASDMLNDADEARNYAWSAVDLARLWMGQDALWRAHRANGVWVNSQAIGGGSFRLTVTDPVDGNLANDTTDPVLIHATGFKGQAQQMVDVRLINVATPIDILSYSLAAAGAIQVDSNDQLIANRSTIATNGTLTNNGAVGANVECLLALPVGAITGSCTILSTLRPFPGSAPVTMYTALGTSVTPPSTMQGFVMGPGINPFGTSDPNGIYVLRPTGNLTIRDCRVYGTLLIICNSGKTVTFDRNVFIQPAKPSNAGLIVSGNAVFQYDSAGATVSEAGLGVNLNPSGAPYNGLTNGTMTDTYPCEIRGLVHVTGTATLGGTALIRAALICEGTPLLSPGVEIKGNNEIVYDPTLFTNPPVGYQKGNQMVVDTAGRKQSVN